MEVHVPDLLWKDRKLPEGARYLWAVLWMLRVVGRCFSFSDLRRFTGLSHRSVVKYLRELANHGWLHYARVGRKVEVSVLWPVECAFLKLQDDVLLDHSLPHAARWVWGVIRRLGEQFTYGLLIELTGYSHNSLTKYLRMLSGSGYLVGTVARVSRRKHFDYTAGSPAEVRRQEELEVFWREKSLVDLKPGYSFGQFMLARMVELCTHDHIVENAEMSCLQNRKTGGRLQVDVLLTHHSAAIEFQGPQHVRTTQLYPSAEELRAQQERDQLKRELSARARIKLGEVHARDLCFGRVEQVLIDLGVPTRPVPDEKRYVYQELLRYSERYRAKVRQDELVPV